MSALPYILADSDVNWPKLIFGAIFLIIWAISAFVSWINKQQQEAKRRRVREELEGTAQRTQVQMRQQMRQQMREQGIPPRIAEGLAQRFPDVLLPPAPPPPIPQQQRRPMPIPRPPAQPKAQRRATKQTPAPRSAPLPPPPIMLEEVTATPQASPILAPSRARSKLAVDAAALSKWMTPATLRQQFMLTEILQPPLALRPDVDPRLVH